MSSEHASSTIIHPEKPRVFDNCLCDLSFRDQCHISSLILALFFEVTTPQQFTNLVHEEKRRKKKAKGVDNQIWNRWLRKERKGKSQ